MDNNDQEDERVRLLRLINDWNEDHYDIFELTKPNEQLEFYGVVRFFYQDDGTKVATKCVRVASSATAKEVVEVLVEKFRADMRMLTQNKYALYEVHVNGEERKLEDQERPLFIQLNWGKDVREGRLLLKREMHKTAKSAIPDGPKDASGFNRKLSKREKKDKKKFDKGRKGKENIDHDASLAEQLYNELPETSFTRSISNPEAVMRKRREQKLQKRLQDGDNTEGTLKIFGMSLRPDIPYKTLLLSLRDTVAFVILETMEKYGLEKEDPAGFCLIKVVTPKGNHEYHGSTSTSMGEETVLDDAEYPLAIWKNHNFDRGNLMFQICRHPSDMKKRPKRNRAQSHEDLRSSAHPNSISHDKVPYLVELSSDGSENPSAKIFRLHLDVTEVGNSKAMMTGGSGLQLFGANVQPRHCVIAHSGGIVTVTPRNRDAKTYVENELIFETTMLLHGMRVRFGRQCLFRFIDPKAEEKLHKGQSSPDGPQQRMGQPSPKKRQPDRHTPNFETTFDVQGHIDTKDGGVNPRNDDRQRGMEELQRRGAPMQGQSPIKENSRSQEDVLPANIEFLEEAEDTFLMTVIPQVNTSSAQFKLAPTYSLYMAIRFRLSMEYRPDIIPTERAYRLTTFVNKLAGFIQHTIQDNHDNPAALAFWMANASELLHFCKQDQDVHPFTADAQEVLAEDVQLAFHHLVRCLQEDLERTMPVFLDESSEADEDDRGDTRTAQERGKPGLAGVLETLSAAMHLLRRCRVNAALTIQLFSQLFHFINMWLFNALVTQPQLQLCTRAWGDRFKRRLGRIEAWAEKQGLELAADCHLCRIIQAAHLLQAPKSNPNDIANISSTCFKLNSLQLRELLQQYHPAPNEPHIPPRLIEQVVEVAENMADELARTDGREIRLKEDPDLQLPFLLPEDGYSCDIIRGVPPGLPEFIEPMLERGFCRMMIQPASRGLWTIYMVSEETQKMNEQNLQRGGGNVPGMNGGPGILNDVQSDPQQGNLPKQPEIITISFDKAKGTKGPAIGLSIVAAKPEGKDVQGIYIKSVVPGGGAAQDGRLQAGDQLLEVDGNSLVDLSQEKAAGLMTQTGQTVTLKVAKQGAIYDGLVTLLNQPSPTMPRAGIPSPIVQNSPASRHRPKSDDPWAYGDGPQKPNQRDYPQQRDSPRTDPKQRAKMQQPHHARSSPALNVDPQGGDRTKAISTGNLIDPAGPAQKNHMPPEQFREHDPRSKSTTNLHPNNNALDQRDPHNMRQAQSVSVLSHPGQNRDYPQYQDDMKEDPRINRPNNYVNQPTMSNVDQNRNSQNERGYTDINHNLPQGPQITKPQHQSNDRGSIRSSMSSSKDDQRPVSAYITPHERPEYASTRPKSTDLSSSRPRDLEDQPSDRNSYNSPHLQNNPGYVSGPQHAPQDQRSYMPGQQQPPQNDRGLGPNDRNMGQQPNDRSSGQGQQPNERSSGQGQQPNDRSSGQGQPNDRSFGQGQQPNDRSFGQGQPNDRSSGQGQPNDRSSGQGQPNDRSSGQGQPNDRIFGPGQQRSPSDHVPNQQQSPSDRGYGPQNSFNDRGYDKPSPPRSREQPRSHTQSQELHTGYGRELNSSKQINDIPKISINNQVHQPNFYANTAPKQQEAAPPFHQLRKPNEGDGMKPAVAPKPPIAIKPDQGMRVTPQEIPRSEANSRQTQPHFFNPQEKEQPSQRPGEPPSQRPGEPPSHRPGEPLYSHAGTSQQNYGQQPQYPQQSAGSIPFSNYQDQRQPGRKISPGREPRESPELPPPPPNVPPEIPPPPVDDFQEELPPPPPMTAPDMRYDIQLREEQGRLMNQLDPRNGYLNSYNPYQDSPEQGRQFDNRKPQHDYQNIVNYQEDRQPPKAPVSQQANSRDVSRQQVNNVNRGPQHNTDNRHNTENRVPQHNAENRVPQHNAENRVPQHNADMNRMPQQNTDNRMPQQNTDMRGRPQTDTSRPPIPKMAKEKAESMMGMTPWQREEKEKKEKLMAEDFNRLREQEIRDLESRSSLTQVEHDRLQKLRLDHEFERRVQEVSERDDEDSDTDTSPNGQVREKLIQRVQEDLLRTRQRMETMNEEWRNEEFEIEKDRLLRLERKLEMFDNERADQRKRQQKIRERKEKEQEEYLRKQREMREKQRQEFEEQKRLHLQEEEKMRLRKEEELRRKRETERQQYREMQTTRDAEETALREEVRRREDEFSRQRLAQKEQERLDQQREIRVSDQRRRLDAAEANKPNNFSPSGSSATQGPARYTTPGAPNYQTDHVGPNLSVAPPPPQRNSSYDQVNQPQYQALDNNDPYRDQRPGIENDPYRDPRLGLDLNASKKSVTFNTQVNMYSDERQGYPSFRSSNSSQSSEPMSPTGQPFVRGGQPLPPFQSAAPAPEVFTSPIDQNNDVQYLAGDTPGVIGSKEVYRDPRTRIQAKKAAQSSASKKSAERMSFRDKMKYFAQEAGETTPKDRSKSSKSQREIESQMNGQ